MKKLMGLILTAVLITGLLAGCAGTPAGNGGTSTPESTPAASDTSTSDASNEATTRIYTDKAGRKVEIPVNPQRIITINMTAEAIALGVKPIGAADNWLEALDDLQKEGIESIGAVASLNIEKILELEPDLIITPERVTNEETWEALSKIAPTVVGPFFGDAFENLRTVGDLLGRSEDAEAWISDYEEKAAKTKESLSDVITEGKTALVVQLSSQKAIYIYPSSTWPTVHEVLGLVLPDAEELRELTAGADLSLEKLAEYDPDYIFVTGNPDEQYKEEILSGSVWKSLSASKNNQVYIIGNRLSSGDVLALDWALDEIVRAVEKVNN
jgi:iron complex transport system substrate-binding protein